MDDKEASHHEQLGDLLRTLIDRKKVNMAGRPEWEKDEASKERKDKEGVQAMKGMRRVPTAREIQDAAEELQLNVKKFLASAGARAAYQDGRSGTAKADD